MTALAMNEMLRLRVKVVKQQAALLHLHSQLQPVLNLWASIRKTTRTIVNRPKWLYIIGQNPVYRRHVFRWTSTPFHLLVLKNSF